MAAALALLAFVVVLSGLTGPVVRSGPGVAPAKPQVSEPLSTGSGPATSIPSNPPRRPSAPRTSFWARLWLVAGVLLALALTAAVVMLVVRLQPLPRTDSESPPPPGATPGATPAPPSAWVAAADEGLALLSTASDTGDAVIACWVRLERAAEATGRPRHPAATPTEFTADLLVAGIGQEAAVRELLGLYHGARFGSHPLPPGAAARAVACLEAIRATAQERAAAR